MIESIFAPRRASGLIVAALCGMGLTGAPRPAAAQWSTTYEQFYLPGDYNWMFRKTYPAADRLFNAFDYGHAILYEKLYTQPGADVSVLETTEYNFITRKLLVSPPRIPLEEAAIEVQYAKMAPEAKAMFDWAHLLHRQIYDVLAAERMTQTEKDETIATLIRYYKTRPDLAFSSIPKNMDLMEGQPYSLVFRQRYPKFNGLIWGYHWLQVGLYEPMMVGRTQEERQAGVSAAVSRFRQMLENAPEHMPRIMPMTAAIAPEFSKRYAEAAIIFDNLHSMHDVVSDILASPTVPRNQKRMEILKAAARYRDATSFLMTETEWLEMSRMMGAENMGGPAVGILPIFPTPTIERGMPMAKAMQSMNHANMPGMKPPADTAKGHDMATMTPRADTSKTTGSMAGMDHSKMAGMKPDSTKVAAAAAMSAMDHAAMGHGSDSAAMHASMMDAFMKLTSDSIIRNRIAADTGLRRSLETMIEQMPAAHRAHMTMLLPVPTRPSVRPPARRPAPTAATPTRKITPAVAKPPLKVTPKTPTTTKKVDPMAGMDHSKMPGMAPPPKKPDTTRSKRPPVS